jgi:hypothetical protein
MRAWTSSLLAVLPWLPPANLPRAPSVPCVLAVDVQVRAHLQWGSLEWHLFTGEVERVWAPYGLTFCWAEGPRGCEGIEARVDVLIADDLPASAVRETARLPVVGRITFHAGAPGSDIALSVTSARTLVVRATLGGRRVSDWPAAIAQRFIPRVLGRALAHEIGHYVLGTRDHAARGLMSASFTPDDVTLASTSRFHLPGGDAARMRLACVARALDVRSER